MFWMTRGLRSCQSQLLEAKLVPESVFFFLKKRFHIQCGCSINLINTLNNSIESEKIYTFCSKCKNDIVMVLYSNKCVCVTLWVTSKSFHVPQCRLQNSFLIYHVSTRLQSKHQFPDGGDVATHCLSRHCHGCCQTGQ